MTGTPPLVGWEALADACANAAATLPTLQVEHLADRAAAITDPTQVGSIKDRPPTHNFRHAAAAIVKAWRGTTPLATGHAVAGMLLAAAATAERADSKGTVDLVWTGPGTDDIHAQATDDVLVALISEAERSLILSTFASRRVERVRNALIAASARGVKITLILENESSSNGQYKPPPKDPFDGVTAEILEWPREKRPTRGQWTAALHAKFVIVDETALFITSANLTGFALDLNIETGALIRGGPLPARLHNHLRNLAYSHILTPVQ